MGMLTDILKDLPVNAVLRDKLQQLEQKYEELETENAQLKSENQRLNSKVKELTSSDELCEDEVRILKLLSSSGQELIVERIATSLDLNLTKAEYYLERLLDQDYIDAADYVGSSSEYYLIQKGREYLIKNNLI